MGARADVLSTQSTREPDVVNGMRESMGSGSRLCFRWACCRVLVGDDELVRWDDEGQGTCGQCHQSVVRCRVHLQARSVQCRSLFPFEILP